MRGFTEIKFRLIKTKIKQLGNGLVTKLFNFFGIRKKADMEKKTTC